jgi:hypothetical protein
VKFGVNEYLRSDKGHNFMNVVDSLRWHHVRSPYNIPNDILVTMTGPQIAEKLLNAMNSKVLRKIYGPVLANGQQQNNNRVIVVLVVVMMITIIMTGPLEYNFQEWQRH